MDYGQAISEIRLRKKLSRVAFANKLGISRGTLYGIETNKRSPSPKVIRALQKEFGISDRKLFYISLTKDDIEEIKLELFKNTREAILSELTPMS